MSHPNVLAVLGVGEHDGRAGPCCARSPRLPAARHANLSAFECALAASVDAAGPRLATGGRVPFLGAVSVLGSVLLVSWGRSLLELRAPRAQSAGTVVAAPAPAPAVPLEVSATLIRRTSGDSEPLADGDVVRAGDRLALELRAPEPVWVYVLDEDAAGEREPTAARHAGPGPVTRLAEQLASGHDPNLWLRRFTARHGPPESARP